MCDISLGATSLSAVAIAFMCSGVVPQQPPAILRNLDSANSFKNEAVSLGSSS